MKQTIEALQELLDEFNRKPKLNFPRFEIEDMIRAKMKKYQNQTTYTGHGYSIFDKHK